MWPLEDFSPMCTGGPVREKEKLRVQAGPEGPRRGVLVWASLSCCPGAWATHRYCSVERRPEGESQVAERLRNKG